jgi:Ca-activated chloride channel homolog
LKILTAILFGFLLSDSFSQETQLTRILFILDASNSMNSDWGDGQTRFEAAKEILSKNVNQLRDVPNLEIALRVYGHQSPITANYQDCNDTKLEVPFAKSNHDQVLSKIRTIKAKGTTPIAMTLQASAEDFPDKNAKNIIILITDGLEACPMDPCAVARELKAKDINVTPFVVGLGMDLSYLEKFRCIGSYSDAETKESFEKVLSNILSRVLVNTSVQINLNDSYGKPSETDVTLFLYEAGTTNLKYTFTHTINRQGNPDTLFLDPDINYDLVVNTTPRQFKKNITLIKNTHNTIVVSAPQGFIEPRFINAAKPYQVETRIMEQGKGETLNTQKIGQKDKYICGTYDMEILTIPRIYVTVTVAQSSSSYIDIKAPGSLKYTSSSAITGQVFMKNDNGTWDWVLNLSDGSRSGDYQILPGEYRIVYRYKEQKRSEYTITKDFRINSNKSTSLQL